MDGCHLHHTGRVVAILAVILAVSPLAAPAGRAGATSPSTLPVATPMALATTPTALATIAPAALTTIAPAAPTVGPSPSLDPAAWGPVEVPVQDSPVRLVVADEGPNGISLEPTFTLSRTDGGPVDELLDGLTIDPSVTLLPAGTTPEGGLLLHPDEALPRDSQIHITVRGTDGALLGSWVFLTWGPLRVIGTLPDASAEDVPVTTGIEFTFDQPGATDVAKYLSIDPAATGRTEIHDRTVVFVPDRPLEPARTYQVTLHAGVPVPLTDMTLEQDETLEFTTAGSGSDVPDLGYFFRRVAEVGTGDAPLLELQLSRTKVRTVPVEVYRLPTLDASIAAVRAAQAADAYATDRSLAIDTTGLERVLSFDAPPRRASPWDSSDRVMSLPGPLPAGWYVVVIPDAAGDLQVVLQVSDLAVYSHLSWTQSAFWVNDLASRRPVEGAVVRLVDGDALGETGANGLLLTATPAALLGGDPPMLLVESGDRAVLVPFGTGGWSSSDLGPSWASMSGSTSSRYWSLLYTDRLQYRTTDAVNVWGLVRDRDTAAVPAQVTLDLRRDAVYEDAPEVPPIASVTVTPSTAGGYATSLPLDDLPVGQYYVTLMVDGAAVLDAQIEVAAIVKPDYRLTIGAARHVYVAGETVAVATTAEFFDGTPVPGVPLVVSGMDAKSTISSDRRGDARTRLTAWFPGYEDGQWVTSELSARAARGEEGRIDASTDVLVFRSSVVLTAEATIEGDRATLSGSLDRLDRKRLERQYDRAFDLAFDPRGAPVAGAPVGVRIVEEIPVRRKTGTVYDFIAKRVVPVYDYETREHVVGVHTLTSDSRGRYAMTFPVTRGHGYRVELSATDASGRRTVLSVWGQRSGTGLTDFGAYLTSADPNADLFYPHGSYAIGERVVVEMRRGADLQPSGGSNRYLFLAERRGIQRAVLRDKPRYSFEFRASDAPLVEISAIRFTGDTYVAVPDGFAADFDPRARDLTLTLTPRQDRYAPGERATVDVRVTDATGHPVTADVVLRAIDEKLYAIRAASAYDPLDDLYRSVPTGTVRTYASHQLPTTLGPRGEGGDTGTQNPGQRMDFRDQVLFRLVTTGHDGRATVSFDLADDLTSWRVSGTAMTAALQVGEGSTLVPVGLPFFVELVVAPEYLAGDEAAVRVRAYGAGLVEGDTVRFDVRADSLGMGPTTVTGRAFKEIVVPLPALTVGSHTISVSGQRVGSERALTDAVARTIRVVPSRLTQAQTTWVVLDGPVRPEGGDGVTGYLVTDTGRGRAVPVLLELAGDIGARADQSIAAAEARRLLVERFDMDPATLPVDPRGIARFQGRRGGISLLPYASADLELSVLVALAAPDAVDRAALLSWLEDRWSAVEVGDRPVAQAPMVLAGLAALGMPVASEVRVRASADPVRSEEALYLAIAAAATGDDMTARTLLRNVLGRLGQQQGPYVRLLDLRGQPDAEATALLALLAAMLGDLAISDAADRSIVDQPATDTLLSLQRLATSINRMEHAPATPARFAATVDGVRTEHALEPGDTWAISLVPAQRDGFLLEALQGSLMLASTWQEPLDPTQVVDDPAITVGRTVRPAGPVPAKKVVTVVLRVGLGTTALSGCYLLTDPVPSGLAPVAGRWQSQAPDTDATPSIVGQRVTFCVERDPKHPVQVLRYTARVVTPGRYLWEPTLVQSETAPSQRELGTASTIDLR